MWFLDPWERSTMQWKKIYEPMMLRKWNCMDVGNGGDGGITMNTK